MSFEFEISFNKFRLAADHLAASSKNIKERLRRAIYEIAPVGERNVPEELHEQFLEISTRIRNGKPRNLEGNLEATINQITDEEAVNLADDIVSFNEALFLWRIDKAKKNKY